MSHGTIYAYRNGCRCEPCRQAKRKTREGSTKRKDEPTATNRLLADLLHELAPMGLTDDCPVRKARA